MANNLTGFERFFCSSWDGWDGDLEWAFFYDIEPNQLLINDIKKKLPAYKKEHHMVDLHINLSECTAEIKVYYRPALVEDANENAEPLVSHQYTFSLLIG